MNNTCNTDCFTNRTEQIIDKISEELKPHVLPNGGVLAAVSGGSDSMGMMFLLAECQKKFEFKLTVGTINHGLRPEAEEEINLIRRHASDLGIEVISAQIPREEASVAAKKGSLQAWARKRRYELLAEIAKSVGANAIATGHTLDDQAETVLIRLLRGTGIDGLIGIPKSRKLNSISADNSVRIIRPVLGIERAELRQILKNKNITFVDDPSNNNSRFLRVRIRNELLPLMNELSPKVSARLASLTDDAAAAVSFFETDCNWEESFLVRLNANNGLMVARQSFDKLPRSIWSRLIRLAVKTAQGNLRRIERMHLTPIEEFIYKKKTAGCIRLPGGLQVFVDRGSLLIFPQGSFSPITENVLLMEKTESVRTGVLASLNVSVEVKGQTSAPISKLTLRTREKGDRLWQSDSKLKDVLTKHKVPKPYRDLIPVLAIDNCIISCPLYLPTRIPELTVNWHLGNTSPLEDLIFFNKRVL